MQNSEVENISESKPSNFRDSQQPSPDITSFPQKQEKCQGLDQDFENDGDDAEATEVKVEQSVSPFVHMNPIGDIPPNLYEYVLGDAGELRILCKVCQYVSNKKSNFKRHFTNMHFEEENKILECCGMRFTTKGEKFHHVKSVHKAGYKCTICSKVFDRPALLQRHLAKHTGKKPFKCSLCTYQTPNKANAKRHIEKRHSDVSDGSILFVTDDGEQVLIEVISKLDKESTSGKDGSSPGSSSSASIPISNRVIRSYADSSTPFTPATRLAMPRGPTSTLTSGSLLTPTLNAFPFGFGSTGDQRRDVSHSIDKIINPFNDFFSSSVTGGNDYSSFSSPSVIPAMGFNNPSINELTMNCSPNWSQPSTPSPFPFYKAQPYFPQSPFLASSAPALLQSQYTGPFLFHQCLHGCWHLDNQMTTSGFPRFPLQSSPDLRSSSSFSQYTENASASFSLKTDEEEEDDDEVDVVGMNSGDESTSSTSKKLKVICEVLESCSTAEERDISEAESCPPVDLTVKNQAQAEDETLGEPEYIPKKLRVSKAYFREVQKKEN